MYSMCRRSEVLRALAGVRSGQGAVGSPRRAHEDEAAPPCLPGAPGGRVADLAEGDGGRSRRPTSLRRSWGHQCHWV